MMKKEILTFFLIFLMGYNVQSRDIIVAVPHYNTLYYQEDNVISICTNYSRSRLFIFCEGAYINRIEGDYYIIRPVVLHDLTLKIYKKKGLNDSLLIYTKTMNVKQHEIEITTIHDIINKELVSIEELKNTFLFKASLNNPIFNNQLHFRYNIYQIRNDSIIDVMIDIGELILPDPYFQRLKSTFMSGDVLFIYDLKISLGSDIVYCGCFKIQLE
jgi:hypothetical protein